MRRLGARVAQRICSSRPAQSRYAILAERWPDTPSLARGFFATPDWMGCGLLTSSAALRFQPCRALALTVERTDKGGLSYVQARLALDGADTATLKRKLLFCPDEERIQLVLDAVQAQLGLSDAELKKVVLRLPPIIGYSFEGNIKPTLDALQAQLGLSESELKKVVLHQPSIMSCSVENTLIPNLAFWRTCFGDELTEAEVAAKVMGPNGPRQLAQSHGRLQSRAALFDARGIARQLLWGKAQLTDTKLDAWVARQAERG